jgi:hypothetical protein
MGTPEGCQKSIFNTTKLKKTKIHMGLGIYPTKFAGSTQKQKKNYRSTIETKKISNKYI